MNAEKSSALKEKQQKEEEKKQEEGEVGGVGELENVEKK